MKLETKIVVLATLASSCGMLAGVSLERVTRREVAAREIKELSSTKDAWKEFAAEWRIRAHQCGEILDMCIESQSASE